ncbi:MAG: hypothetical protein JO269_09645 [Burkholderiaceae bacterium]|nr:hypothetical protein [Burkholderiaceae bacterium]
MNFNFQSEFWKEFSRHLEKLREIERTRLEAPSKDHDETQYMRGKIAAYKELLALPQQAAALASNDRPE